MKKIIIAMAAIAAAFTMASCNKELVEPENNPTEGNCIITASTESALTKTSLSGSDSEGYEVRWSEDDQITIGGNTFTLIEGANTTTGKFQGTLPEGDGPFYAYYPAEYDGTDWPTTQVYTAGNITGSPMKAEVVKGAESLSFKNEGGILRLTVNGTAAIQTIKVSADGLDDITLNCGSVNLNNTGTVFHIAMPDGDYEGVSFYIRATDNNYCFKKLKEGKTLKIERSKITTASFTVDFPSSDSTDPLTGVFSVSASKQVCFSKGNLWYGKVGTAQTATFQFEAKQYSFHGYDDDTWGLFGWSTAATKFGMNLNTKTDKYSGSFVDWGNAIDNNKTWRTLTKDEWTYLFEGRTGAAEKYGYGKIGNVFGLFVLPDEFTDPKKNGGSGAFKPQSSSASSWNDNYYTLGGNWEAMEVAGAVFLPAAGRRYGEVINYASNPSCIASDTMYGLYWSSSDIEGDEENAYYVEFTDTHFKPAVAEDRSFGCSVRLVTNLFTVTFDMNGKIGKAPESLKKIPHGSTISKPTDPTAVNYDFKGWYTDQACTKSWNFSSDVVTENTTLYAKWAESSSPYKAILSKFTVNAEGKEVCFSAGNLIATIDANGDPIAWKFAANQYDFLGKSVANKNNGTVAEDVDLFVRSTESTNYGVDSSGSDREHSTVFVDWGKAIGDGSTWYTLAEEEWEYLFLIRPNAADKYGLGVIGDAPGLIILPDVFTDPMKNGGSNAFVPGTGNGYNANVYNLSGNWKAMEAAGAVFLPSNGEGCYWSSSLDFSTRGWVIFINGSYFSPATTVDWIHNCFVRLVTNCE